MHLHNHIYAKSVGGTLIFIFNNIKSRIFQNIKV